MTIQDALGAQIAIGNGALLGTNSGTFWAAGGLEVASALAAFIQVDNARPIPLKRFYWPGGEGIEYAFEV